MIYQNNFVYFRDHQKPDEESDESLVREYNEEAGYAYTLPRKNKPAPQAVEDNGRNLLLHFVQKTLIFAETSESEEDDEDAANRVGYETVRPEENMKMMETIQDHSHILKSPVLPRKTYSRWVVPIEIHLLFLSVFHVIKPFYAITIVFLR